MELKLGRYRHYKGNLYRILGLARQDDPSDNLVIYECLSSNSKSKLLIRPMNMFTDMVLVDGKEVPQFVYVGEE